MGLARVGRVFGLCAILAITPAESSGQSASLGADIVSRSFWRGFFGGAIAAQPILAISGSRGFELGAWGSYPVSSGGDSINVTELWIGYAATSESGARVSIALKDYYFPIPNSDASYLEAAGHALDGSVAVTGPAAFPLSILFAQLLNGDGSYLEASAPFSGWGAKFGLTGGLVLGDSDFYGTEGISLVNLGASASKEIEITRGFAPPVTVSYIVNPDRAQAYLTWGIRLRR